MLPFHKNTLSVPKAPTVTVIGLGGAGGNFLEALVPQKDLQARLIAAQLNQQALEASRAQVKIQLGENLTLGLGAGGDPDIGLEAARQSAETLRGVMQGQDIVFLCVGLGGGTGSGAAPEVARYAAEQGAFVVVFATMPFSFEGKRRVRQAQDALENLRAYAHALIVFDNDRIGELLVPQRQIRESFAAADRLVAQAISAIVGLVTRPGLIRIGLDEMLAVLQNNDCRCLFGAGTACGSGRAKAALANALRSPLLQREEMLQQAGTVLVQISGGSQLSFQEVQTVMTSLREQLHEDAHVLFGVATDESLGDMLSVTILTSLDRHYQSSLTPALEEKPKKISRRASRAKVEAAPVEEDLFAQELSTPAVAHEEESSEMGAHQETTPVAEEDQLPEASIESSEQAPEMQSDEELVAASAQEIEEYRVAEEVISVAAEANTVEPCIEEPTVDTSPAISEMTSRPEIRSARHRIRPEWQFSTFARPHVEEEELETVNETPQESYFKAWKKLQTTRVPVLPNPSALGATPTTPPEAATPEIPQPTAELNGDEDEYYTGDPTVAERLETAVDAGISRLKRLWHRSRSTTKRTPVKPQNEEEFEEESNEFSLAQTEPLEQATFDEQMQPRSRGRFQLTAPTVEDGTNLDEPAYLRRRRQRGR